MRESPTTSIGLLKKCTAAWRSILSEWKPLCVVFVWGTALRVLYFAATSFEDRSYDSSSHVNYMNYVIQHFRIPPANIGWEMHQPPLYYFLTASWVKLGIFVGRSIPSMSIDIRLFSLLLSIGMLVVILWIAAILFPAPQQRWQATVFALVAGTLPGIVMAATRINNDVLAFFLSFLWCAFMLRWWRDGRSRDFWWAVVLLGIGMVTKFTAGVLALPMALMIFARSGIFLRRKFSLMFGLICGMVALSGWYFLLWSFEYMQNLATGGAGPVNAMLALNNHARDFFIFNPLALLMSPFAKPWDALSDRAYIWEYLFRSTFFGEWTYDNLVWLCRAIIAVGLTGLAAGVLGFVREWRTWEFTKPLAILTIVLLFLLALYRVMFPCACNEDFRFIPLLAVPVAAWAVAGFGATGRSASRWGMIFGILFAVLQSVFLLSFLITG